MGWWRTRASVGGYVWARARGGIDRGRLNGGGGSGGSPFTCPRGSMAAHAERRPYSHPLVPPVASSPATPAHGSNASPPTRHFCKFALWIVSPPFSLLFWKQNQIRRMRALALPRTAHCWWLASYATLPDSRKICGYIALSRNSCPPNRCCVCRFWYLRHIWRSTLCIIN